MTGPARAPLVSSRPRRRIVHGVVLDDPYDWLRAENWQDVLRDPAMLPSAIREVLDAENGYVASCLDAHAGRRDALLAEMRGRIVEDDASVPVRDGAWLYYRRYRPGGQLPLYRRLPKRGFSKPNRLSFAVVNLGQLQSLVDAGKLKAGDDVTEDALVAAGATKRKLDTLHESSDKENDEHVENPRSAKKVKPTPAPSTPAKVPASASKAARRTPGSAMSKSRLAFLATPKRTKA